MRQFLAVSTLAIAVANSAHGGTVNGFETGYYVGVDAGQDQFRGPAFFGYPLAVDEERTTTFNYDGLIDFDQAVDCLLGTCPRAQINSLEGEGVEYAIAAAGAETGLRVAAAFDIPEDLLFNEEVRVTPAVAIARYVDILTVRSRRVDEVRLQFTIDGLFLGPFVGLKFSAQTEPNDTRFVIGDFGDLEEIGGAFSVFSTQTRT